MLAEHGPPTDADAADKFERGQVVVLGGDAETPGGVVLTALAALRAGAGRAHVITEPTVASGIAVANPELRVSPLPTGSVADAPEMVSCIEDADVVVIGPGCLDRDRTSALVEEVHLCSRNERDAVPRCGRVGDGGRPAVGRHRTQRTTPFSSRTSARLRSCSTSHALPSRTIRGVHSDRP